MTDRRFRELWDSLQGQKAYLPHFLSGIVLDGIRGFNNLRVMFDYPVSVIAGGNTTGKSTIVKAAACAYKVPGAGVRDHAPSTQFPNHRPKFGKRQDTREEVKIEFNYLTLDGPCSMRWRRAKGWTRSFFGHKNASQPVRPVYLRRSSDLNSPAEVRSVLNKTARLKSKPEETPLTAAQIEFAYQIFPFRYSEVVDISIGNKNLLFAAQENGAAYSELHMAAGERAILRLSQEIAQLNGALVLIDEVEAGLHPVGQQMLMLHLQQLALRNDLQIIVTSHSPVVLDCVPFNGKIFLDRDEVSGEVVVRPAYRDLMQNALYGRTNEKLKLFCEDNIAEGILKGILDFLLSQEQIKWELVHIGCVGKASEFPIYARALADVNQIQDTVFILDSEQRNGEVQGKIQKAVGHGANNSILFLPGSGTSESWVLEKLHQHLEVYASRLEIDPGDLSNLMNRLDAIYASASDSSSEIAKNKFRSLSDSLRRDPAEICRIVAHLEADHQESDIQPLVGELRGILRLWRG